MRRIQISARTESEHASCDLKQEVKSFDFLSGSDGRSVKEFNGHLDYYLYTRRRFRERSKSRRKKRYEYFGILAQNHHLPHHHHHHHQGSSLNLPPALKRSDQFNRILQHLNASQLRTKQPMFQFKDLKTKHGTVNYKTDKPT